MRRGERREVRRWVARHPTTHGRHSLAVHLVILLLLLNEFLERLYVFLKRILLQRLYSL